MGLARDAFRTVTLAATAGLVVGGVLGVLAADAVLTLSLPGGDTLPLG
jgi:hypothetical protein